MQDYPQRGQIHADLTESTRTQRNSRDCVPLLRSVCEVWRRLIPLVRLGVCDNLVANRMNPLTLVAPTMNSLRVWSLLIPIGGFLLGFFGPLLAAWIYVAQGGQSDAAGAFTFLPIVTSPAGLKIGWTIRQVIIRDINDTWD